MEPDQCFGVVCNAVTIPGAPETWIVDKPSNPSNSRNASFTYMGSDSQTPITELVFECRIDSTDPFAWEDCEYPAEYRNLSARAAHVRDPRHRRARRRPGRPDARAATRGPTRRCRRNDPPETFIDVKPPAQTWLLDAVFTFHSNEPDVTFECKVDAFPYEPCGFEMVMNMQRGALRVGPRGDRGRPAHVLRARHRLRGQRRRSRPPTRGSCSAISTVFLPGPNPESTGFTPPETPLDPATGGETLSTTATIDFQANVADATFECSLDLEPFVPCAPPVTYTNLHARRAQLLRHRDGPRRRPGDGARAEYEWEIVDPIDTTPPDTSIELAPPTGSSNTRFEFTGTDDLTPPELITYECRIDSTNALDWESCVSPYNLLEFYTYEDPQMAPGQHTFEVRAVDAAEPSSTRPTRTSRATSTRRLPATRGR